MCKFKRAFLFLRISIFFSNIFLHFCGFALSLLYLLGSLFGYGFEKRWEEFCKFKRDSKDDLDYE